MEKRLNLGCFQIILVELELNTNFVNKNILTQKLVLALLNLDWIELDERNQLKKMFTFACLNFNLLLDQTWLEWSGRTNEWIRTKLAKQTQSQDQDRPAGWPPEQAPTKDDGFAHDDWRVSGKWNNNRRTNVT